jgi:hypothetical protein
MGKSERPARPANWRDDFSMRRYSHAFKAAALLALATATAFLTGAAGASTTTTPNGTWTAYPGSQTVNQTSVQQPINADGSSNFKSNGNAVIPVKFAISSGTGPFMFESIYSDNTSLNDGLGTCGTGSGADHANDCAFLSFTPNSTVTFNQIKELSAVYAFTVGDCHGGSLRWSVRVSPTQSVFIYYGLPSEFGNGGTGGCTPTSPAGDSQSGINMISLTDLRYDTSQVGGKFYDDYAGALALVGAMPITRASLVLDSGWGGDQRLTLTSATFATSAFTDTFVPPPSSPLTAMCPTQEATIQITKTGGTPTGAVNEPTSIQPNDNNGIFRIVDCKYMYNLATSSLSGVGRYEVEAVINGTAATNPAFFDLR